MQPLYYQIGTTTCWITSIINGIIYLRGKYGGNEDARIESCHYKTLNAELNSILRSNGVFYDAENDTSDLDHILNVLGACFSMRFRCVRKKDVVGKILDLEFEREVVVCDIGNGAHSILLNGKSECGNWLDAFDPWWYEQDQSREEVTPIDKVERLCGASVNVRIDLNHLLRDPLKQYNREYKVGLAYPMGQNIETRFLTVIEYQNGN